MMSRWAAATVALAMLATGIAAAAPVVTGPATPIVTKPATAEAAPAGTA